MVEFIIGKKVLVNVIKLACVMKTPKSRGIIDTIEFDVQKGQMVVKGIDNGGTVMSCVRVFMDENNVKEIGTFVYAPKELMNKINYFGDELVVRIDDENIYVTDTNGETSHQDALPNVTLDFPVDFRILEDKILPEEDIEVTHKTIVKSAPPKLGKDVHLYFGQNGFSIGHEDELTKFQKRLGSEKFDEELKIKLDGNFFDKITSVIGDEFILGANEDIVFLYTREDWGDVAYMMSTLA